MGMTSNQRGIAAGMGLSLLLALSSILPAAFGRLPSWLIHDPCSDQPSCGIVDHIAQALQWDLLIFLPVLVTIMRLAKFRFFSPTDINAAVATTQSDTARVMNAVIQNTIEQAVLAVGAHLVWAATMPRESQSAIPIAACLFFAGRLLFVSQYEQGGAARSAGFATTFYPSVIMLVSLAIYNLYTLLKKYSKDSLSDAVGDKNVTLLLSAIITVTIFAVIAEKVEASSKANDEPEKNFWPLSAPLTS